MAKKSSGKLVAAMREVHENIPKNVTKTGKKGAAKEAMLRAIAFSKSGESKYPSMARGGIVSATGPFMVHAGEVVSAAPGKSMLGKPVQAPNAYTGSMPPVPSA